MRNLYIFRDSVSISREQTIVHAAGADIKLM